jgi:hypothetical protein
MQALSAARASCTGAAGGTERHHSVVDSGSSTSTNMISLFSSTYAAGKASCLRQPAVDGSAAVVLACSACTRTGTISLARHMGRFPYSRQARCLTWPLHRHTQRASVHDAAALLPVLPAPLRFVLLLVAEFDPWPGAGVDDIACTESSATGQQLVS